MAFAHHQSLRLMNKTLLTAWLLVFYLLTNAQVTEFKKGWTTEARLQTGAVTNFKANSSDIFTGGLLLTEHVTVAPGRLKAGAIAGLIYLDKKFQGLFGPELLLNIHTFNAGELGSIGNLHLSASWLFGTEHEQLVGGGIHVSLLNLITIGLTGHRDYKQNEWWLQSVVSFRLSKIKKTPEPFNQ